MEKGSKLSARRENSGFFMYLQCVMLKNLKALSLKYESGFPKLIGDLAFLKPFRI